MSKQTKQKSSDETARVKVGKLMEKDKELKNAEAGNIRGGGGPSGGVLDRRDHVIGRPGQ